MKLNAWAMLALITSVVYSLNAFAQSTAVGGPTPSPPGAKVEFVDLKDGAVIGPRR